MRSETGLTDARSASDASNQQETNDADCGDEQSSAQILEAVDAKTAEIAAFLQRLIQFDSETGKEGPIQDVHCGEPDQQMGLEVDQWVPDLAELAKHPAYIPAKGRDFSGRPECGRHPSR